MNNAELIKVLRCELYGDDECDTSDCPIWSELGCRNGIANRAAADALEAADKRIDAQEKEIERLNKELEIWSARSFEGKIGSMALKNMNLKMRIAELERILKAVQENSGINFRMWAEAEAELKALKGGEYE